MQGQPELGGAPGQVLPPSGSLSDLAEGAGEVSLHQASKDSGAGETPGAQSGDDVEWPILNYENIFRFAFQEVPVQQTTEDVSTLDLFLEISSEEKPGLGSVHKLCSESRKLWRALQNTDTTLTSQCLWSESRCQENYFLVLGIDAAQKSLSGGQGHTAEGPDLKEPGDPSAHGFRLHRCRALIQTKLSGTPGGRQGSLITYSLFLKTPFHGNTQHITFPRKKKMFPPRNLKMMLFNSNVC